MTRNVLHDCYADSHVVFSSPISGSVKFIPRQLSILEKAMEVCVDSVSSAINAVDGGRWWFEGRQSFYLSVCLLIMS